jgi:hypothetical protein
MGPVAAYPEACRLNERNGRRGVRFLFDFPDPDAGCPVLLAGDGDAGLGACQAVDAGEPREFGLDAPVAPVQVDGEGAARGVARALRSAMRAAPLTAGPELMATWAKGAG